MKEEKKTPWYYYVHVSKDSPKNINRGFWTEETPDLEYWRGYYVPGAYTTLEDAKRALSYYEKGYVEKRRTIITTGYGIGHRYGSETVKVLTMK